MLGGGWGSQKGSMMRVMKDEGNQISTKDCKGDKWNILGGEDKFSLWIQLSASEQLLWKVLNNSYENF